MPRYLRIFFTLLLVLVFIRTCRLPGGAEGEKVVVYTPFPELTAKALKKAFEEETGIKVVQIRDGTTRVFGRLKAERERPVADVWYGGGGIVPFMAASREGLLESYVPRGFRDMPENRGNLVLRAPDFQWVGMCIIALGYAYNPQVLSESEIPKTWEEMVDPRYKGMIEMWDPGVSGTAMLFLGSSLMRFRSRGLPESEGWEYLKKYWLNLKAYTAEGKPAFNVARGSVAIGIHFEHQVLEFVEEQSGGDIAAGSDNISWYLPPDSPVSVDGICLIKNGPNPDNGKRFIDFVMSDKGQAIVNRFFFSIDPSRPPPVGFESHTLEEIVAKAQKLDTDWMAENHNRIRKTWQDEVEQIEK